MIHTAPAQEHNNLAERHSQSIRLSLPHPPIHTTRFIRYKLSGVNVPFGTYPFYVIKGTLTHEGLYPINPVDL